MKTVISANKVFKLLLFIIFLLTCAHIAVQVLRFTTGHDVMFGLIPMFDMNRESNIPTLYSGQALFLASLLLYFTARVCKEKKCHMQNTGMGSPLFSYFWELMKWLPFTSC